MDSLEKKAEFVSSCIEAYKVRHAMKGADAANMFEKEGVLDYLIDDIDLVLVMSVNPGFGGQSFIDSQLRKIEEIRRRIDASGRAIELEVDGGIDANTAPRAIAAGATALVAGTATFRGGPDAYAANIQMLRGA